MKSGVTTGPGGDVMQALLAALQARVGSHAGAHQQHDDITLLCLARA